MPFLVHKTALPGVLTIETEKFADGRGFFMETYHQGKYAEGGMDRIFVQDNYSHSKKGVLRGLHYQLNHPQEKLIYVISGEIFDVVLDIRVGSPTFGKWVGTHLSRKNRRQIFLAGGFAHGFCVLSTSAGVIYKCTDFYYPEDEYGILWSDPRIHIDWPVKNPLLSEKDRRYPILNEIPQARLPVHRR
ncbi:MAG: dTDP-4-dehydrorhamnose 3,5-epimerase [Pseudomonadota bacterium]